MGWNAGGEHPSPHLTPFGDSVGRVWATNIGLLYRKYVIILGGIFLLTSPNQNIGGCVPGIPGGVDASSYVSLIGVYKK